LINRRHLFFKVSFDPETEISAIAEISLCINRHQIDEMSLRHFVLRAACGRPISLPAKLSRRLRRYCGIRPEAEKQQLFLRFPGGFNKDRPAADRPVLEGRDSRESPLMCQAITGLLWPFSGTF
jgi:hypothetical protein